MPQQEASISLRRGYTEHLRAHTHVDNRMMWVSMIKPQTCQQQLIRDIDWVHGIASTWTRYPP